MGKHEIKLLVDPGSNNTVLSSKLNDKVDMEYQGSALLEINAAAECKAITKGEMYLLKLPTKEGVISITGYKINKTPAEVDEDETKNLAMNWPSLNDEIRQEVLENRFRGKADILFGRDNYWSLVLEGVAVGERSVGGRSTSIVRSAPF